MKITENLLVVENEVLEPEEEPTWSIIENDAEVSGNETFSSVLNPKQLEPLKPKLSESDLSNTTKILASLPRVKPPYNAEIEVAKRTRLLNDWCENNHMVTDKKKTIELTKVHHKTLTK